MHAAVRKHRFDLLNINAVLRSSAAWDVITPALRPPEVLMPFGGTATHSASKHKQNSTAVRCMGVLEDGAIISHSPGLARRS
jgi:hypothetical protein